MEVLVYKLKLGVSFFSYFAVWRFAFSFSSFIGPLRQLEVRLPLQNRYSRLDIVLPIGRYRSLYYLRWRQDKGTFSDVVYSHRQI